MPKDNGINIEDLLAPTPDKKPTDVQITKKVNLTSVDSEYDLERERAAQLLADKRDYEDIMERYGKEEPEKSIGIIPVLKTTLGPYVFYFGLLGISVAIVIFVCIFVMKNVVSGMYE